MMLWIHIGDDVSDHVAQDVGDDTGDELLDDAENVGDVYLFYWKNGLKIQSGIKLYGHESHKECKLYFFWLVSVLNKLTHSMSRTSQDN